MTTLQEQFGVALRKNLAARLAEKQEQSKMLRRFEQAQKASLIEDVYCKVFEQLCPELDFRATVERARALKQVQVEVVQPERPAPKPARKGQPAPAPMQPVVVNISLPSDFVRVPDTIRTVPAETETVAERGEDGLVKRSVTRPTGG